MIKRGNYKFPNCSKNGFFFPNKRADKKENWFFNSSIFSKSTRGQGLSVNAIILIILGVFILLIMIIGFMTGWGPLKNLLSPTNVDSIVEDCQSACGLKQEYSFCSAERTLRVNEEDFEVKTSCSVLAGVADFSKYNIQACPSIECKLSCEAIFIDDKKGATNLESGKYDVSSRATGLTEGQKCLVN